MTTCIATGSIARMNLNAYLEANKLSRKDFAPSIDATPSMVSHLANGKRRPSVELAKRIEKATHGKVPAAELLGLVEVKKAKKVAKK